MTRPPPKSETVVPAIIDIDVLRLISEECEVMARQSRILADALKTHHLRRLCGAITQGDARGVEMQIAIHVRELDRVVENWTIASAHVLNAIPKAKEHHQ